MALPIGGRYRLSLPGTATTDYSARPDDPVGLRCCGVNYRLCHDPPAREGRHRRCVSMKEYSAIIPPIVND